MVSQKYRRTGEECPFCEEDAIVKDEQKVEKFCSNCYVVLSKETFEDATDESDPWADFDAYRRESDEYGGWTGPDRIKFVGSFLQPWIEDGDI